jgi:hypothetical protein
MNIRTLFLALAAMAIICIVAQPTVAQGGPGPYYTPQLKFSSQPSLYARVGVPYVYTAVARSMNSMDTIRYYATPDNPPGFAIDAVTGVVTWTPVVRGWYPITIVARSNKGETGMQRFVVTVTSGNGTVQGKVTDSLGAGIPDIIVEVLQADSTSPSSPGCYAFVGRTNQNGSYIISNIDPGTVANPKWYKVHAISPTPKYLSQWYNGALSASEANRIQVLDAPAITPGVDFQLRAGTTCLPFLTVTGTVTDTLANPIDSARVFFVRAEFALNSNSTVDDFRKMFDVNCQGIDFRMEGFSPHVFRALVDTLGKYSVKLLPGLYIAYARAPGYAVEYYFEQPNILTATRLPLRNDTTGINFTLAKFPPVALGTINGSVIDTAKDVGVRSRIIAFRDRWLAAVSTVPAFSYTTDTDTLGVYSIQGLVPGWYYVLALPVGSYAPAFYSNDSLNTRWHRASRVFVNGNTVNGINIFVREIPVAMRGYTSIVGKICLNAGTTPLPGTFVYAIRSGVVAGYGIADGAGQYEINGLAPGTYTVTADYPGFDVLASRDATVSYSFGGVPVTATINLSVSAVATDVTDPSSMQPENFQLSQNYPNPFNPTTVISYQLSVASRTDLRVYDLLGREVAVLVSAVQSPGIYVVTFDASALPSGVYLYQLSTGTTTATKKMVLVK